VSLKPQLAEDAILDSIIYPVWAQPKIDGVRALNLDGTLTGRSLKKFTGTGITERFSQPYHRYLDGEMVLGPDPCAARLCSLTTGAMGAFKGVTEMPDLYWWIFDFVGPSADTMPYAERYKLAEHVVNSAGDARLRLVPFEIVHSRQQVDALMAQWLDDGFEGLILRNPNAVYKEGRATQKGQQLWRIKPWSDFEIKVTGVTEGAKNTNVAKTNELGRTERSSAQAGLVPNGQVGSIQGIILKDVLDHGGRILFKSGMEITAGSGEMTVEEATAWFKDQTQIVGHIAKIKHMTHGVKDLPRFPTFVSKRLAEDMS
jgi:DNA ligase-1